MATEVQNKTQPAPTQGGGASADKFKAAVASASEKKPAPAPSPAARVSAPQAQPLQTRSNLMVLHDTGYGGAKPFAPEAPFIPGSSPGSSPPLPSIGEMLSDVGRRILRQPGGISWQPPVKAPDPLKSNTTRTDGSYVINQEQANFLRHQSDASVPEDGSRNFEGLDVQQTRTLLNETSRAMTNTTGDARAAFNLGSGLAKGVAQLMVSGARGALISGGLAVVGQAVEGQVARAGLTGAMKVKVLATAGAIAATAWLSAGLAQKAIDLKADGLAGVDELSKTQFLGRMTAATWIPTSLASGALTSFSSSSLAGLTGIPEFEQKAQAFAKTYTPPLFAASDLASGVATIVTTAQNPTVSQAADVTKMVGGAFQIAGAMLPALNFMRQKFGDGALFFPGDPKLGLKFSTFTAGAAGALYLASATASAYFSRDELK